MLLSKVNFFKGSDVHSLVQIFLHQAVPFGQLLLLFCGYPLVHLIKVLFVILLFKSISVLFLVLNFNEKCFLKLPITCHNRRFIEDPSK